MIQELYLFIFYYLKKGTFGREGFSVEWGCERGCLNCVSFSSTIHNFFKERTSFFFILTGILFGDSFILGGCSNQLAAEIHSNIAFYPKTDRKRSTVQELGSNVALSCDLWRCLAKLHFLSVINCRLIRRWTLPSPCARALCPKKEKAVRKMRRICLAIVLSVS